MATFPSYNPQYSATKRSQPNLRVTQFGDGYQQRTTFGLNQDPKVWTENNIEFTVPEGVTKARLVFYKPVSYTHLTLPTKRIV